MDNFSSVLLGFLQGATEFLPISSSGHLILAEAYFHVQEAGLTFDVALHMGTLLAVLTYFRADMAAIIRDTLCFRSQGSGAKENRQHALFICVATIPAAVAGLFLEDYAASIFRNPALVALNLAVFGALLLWAERRGTQGRIFQSLQMKDALVIGCAQALAIIPGVSRSGITMTAGLFCNLDRPSVARFSFLLSAPIIFGAGLLNLITLLRDGFEPGQALFFLSGFVAAALSGYMFIAILMQYIQKRSFAVFAYYRFLLAAVVVGTLVL